MYNFDNENQRGLGYKLYFDERSYDCVYICLNVEKINKNKVKKKSVPHPNVKKKTVYIFNFLLLFNYLHCPVSLPTKDDADQHIK